MILTPKVICPHWGVFFFAWMLAAIAGFAVAAAWSQDDAAPQWREDEYARMKRPQSPAEQAKQRVSERRSEQFNPADYRMGEMFWRGLEKKPEEQQPVAKAKGKTKDDFLSKLRIQSEDYLDYNEEKNTIYGRSRTVVRYEDIQLVADKVLIDTRLREAQAIGNVEMTRGKDVVKATKMVFNFDRQQGYATGVVGNAGPLHFMAPKDENPESPAFQKINPKMSLLRESSITGDDFTIPMYHIRAKEFILYEQDRIFARSAMVYVWDTPVAYLPFYTKSLTEAGPWSFKMGFDSQLGGVMSVSYDYYYKDYVPDPYDEKAFVRKSFAQTTVSYDYFTKRGSGFGVTQKYYMDYDRHKGEVNLFQLSDNGREIAAQDGGSDTSRYQASWQHRTNITPELQLLLNLDWLSDPDVHHDILDFFSTQDERRVAERRARAALSLVKEEWLARILFDVRDRVSRDRITDFGQPGDQDSDFSPEFDSKGRDQVTGVKVGRSRQGIPSSRYGRVSQRLPQVTIATEWIRPWEAPVYYQLDLNIFNNLDKGLNTLSTKDDAYVRGFDLYQSLMHAMRIDDQNVWTNKVGVGLGMMQRNKDVIGFEDTKAAYRLDDEEAVRKVKERGFPDPRVEDLYRYTKAPVKVKNRYLQTNIQDKTISYDLNREVTLDGYSAGFGYADYESKWTTRFTESLKGYLRYFIRKGSDSSLGEVYRQLGDRQALDDLYAYRINQHEVGAGGAYSVARPDLLIALDAGRNLHGKGELAPNEAIQYISMRTNYRSPREVFDMQVGAALETFQIRPPSDPLEYERNTATLFGDVRYFPIGDRYWMGLRASIYKNLNQDPASQMTKEQTWENRHVFREDQTRTEFKPTIGAKIGNKWRAEVSTTYDSYYSGLREGELKLIRDMHNAELGLSFMGRKTSYVSSSNNSSSGGSSIINGWDRYRVKASIALKLPGSDKPATHRRISTMDDNRTYARIE
ncbi:MAG: hypothetical protein NTX50_32200 [Candidatus Sumerlaeota bacterium]|nr:hypothetical protein [Candidatus Sumerlaeota bacterium]